MAAVRAHVPRPPPACRSPSTPWISLVVPRTSLPLSLTLLLSFPSSALSPHAPERSQRRRRAPPRPRPSPSLSNASPSSASTPSPSPSSYTSPGGLLHRHRHLLQPQASEMPPADSSAPGRPRASRAPPRVHGELLHRFPLAPWSASRRRCHPHELRSSPAPCFVAVVVTDTVART